MDRQELERQIKTLFSGKRADANNQPDGSGEAESPIHVESLEEFPLNAKMAGEQAADAARAEHWLDTPNSGFGGERPRSFLNGTKEQRDFLLGIIKSLEDGAF